MNILNLNTHDFGGAAKGAYRLHQNLKSIGLSSIMMVLYQKTKQSDIVPFMRKSILFRIKRKLRDKMKPFFEKRMDRDYCFFDYGRAYRKNVRNLQEKIHFKPDIIVAHWVSGFVTPADLHELSRSTGAPIVWYLLDMAPLTGGCHYAWECNGYTQECGMCPALYSNDKHDLSYMNLKRKTQNISHMNITAVCGSHWLAEHARRSTVFKDHRIETILLGIDADIFEPGSRELARAALDLPQDVKIIFFGSESPGEKRKGMRYLIEALHIIAGHSDVNRKAVLIVTAGADCDASLNIDKIFPHRHIGFLSNDKMLATAYRAADVFVCPSVEDAGPMMINESIMCGTPVVSFEMGAAFDLVHTGQTGYRAELKNSTDLAKGMKYMLNLNSDERIRMSAQCRSLGLQLCHPRVQAMSFKGLFDSLLK